MRDAVGKVELRGTGEPRRAAARVPGCGGRAKGELGPGNSSPKPRHPDPGHIPHLGRQTLEAVALGSSVEYVTKHREKTRKS